MKISKKIYFSIGMLMLSMITACTTIDDNGKQQEVNKTVNETESQIDKQNKIKDEDKKDKEEKVTFKADDTEGYMDYISKKPNFEPYYQTVFAFEMLSDGVSSVPLEKVKNMYNDIKNTFDCITVYPQALSYKGYYEGETKFVYGYEEYKNSKSEKSKKNPINRPGWDYDGNRVMSTKIKSVMLGDSIFGQFDNKIVKGRNLEIDDFTIKSPDEPISVVLGSEYMGVYELGDNFSLELISEDMNFEVVGFYEQGVEFSMSAGALENIEFDCSIIMPYIVPEYEPVGEGAIYQHAFLLGERTSVYIPIEEPIEEINDNIYRDYVERFEEIAERNGLSGMYKVAWWPVGFVW